MTAAADELEARRYEAARLRGALVTGRAEPLSGWLRPVAVGLIVTLVGLAVGALASVLAQQ